MIRLILLAAATMFLASCGIETEAEERQPMNRRELEEHSRSKQAIRRRLRQRLKEIQDADERNNSN